MQKNSEKENAVNDISALKFENLFIAEPDVQTGETKSVLRSIAKVNFANNYGIVAEKTEDGYYASVIDKFDNICCDTEMSRGEFFKVWDDKELLNVCKDIQNLDQNGQIKGSPSSNRGKNIRKFSDLQQVKKESVAYSYSNNNDDSKSTLEAFLEILQKNPKLLEKLLDSGIDLNALMRAIVEYEKSVNADGAGSDVIPDKDYKKSKKEKKNKYWESIKKVAKVVKLVAEGVITAWQIIEMLSLKKPGYLQSFSNNNLQHMANKDPLSEKLESVRAKLVDKGMSPDQIGKTGDSRTVVVTPEQQKAALIPTQAVKEAIIARRAQNSVKG